MRKLFLGLCLIVLSSFGLSAQITATIGSVTAEPGTVVTIPITISGASGATGNLGITDLYFDYTPGINVVGGQFVNYSSLTPAAAWVSNLSYDDNTMYNGYLSQVTGANADLPDNTIIFAIQVTYTGPGAVSITWDQTQSYFANFAGDVRTTTWVNGGITPPTPAIVPPVLVAPADLALNLPVATQLSWNAAAGATGYQVQVSTTNNFTTTVVDLPVTGLTHNLTNLNNATTYFWRVKSTTASGSSDWSAVRSFTTVAATPATVTLLTPANAATEIPVAPTLTWNTAANAGSYRLQVSTTNAFTTFVYNDVLTATSKAFTGLFNATTYYWRVQGINGTITGNWSDVRSFTTEASTVPVPSMQAGNLVFTNTTSTGTTLRWTRGNGDNVLVVRYPGNAVSGTPVKGIPYEVGATIGAGTVVYKGNAKRCTVNGLTAGTEYTFKVYEFFNVGPGYNVDNGTLNPRSKTTTYTLSAPTNLAIADFGSDWAEATWDYAATADFFDVQIATDANFANLVSDYIGADFGDEFAEFEGLQGNQQYFVRVRASIDNLFSDWSNTASFTTFFTEPTVAPTALVMNNRTPNTFNVSWTAGNGTKTIVFASAVTSVTAVPADEATYVANSDYSAAATFAGAKVVYNGEGTEFELSGLNPETKYYLAAFTYNGTAGAENYFATPATTNGTTFAAEPTNPTALVFSNRTQNSIKLNWTGAATKYLVLANSTNSTFSTEPTDGTTYTVGAALGTNVTVAAIVTAAELAHTSLTADKRYYYKVYAFNGSNGNENYNLEPATGNAKTLAVVPTAGPATLTISDITVNSMKATWSAVTGVTKYLVLRSTTDNFTAPVNGTTYILNDMLGDATIISTGTELFKANADLAPGTKYYFRAYAVNGQSSSEVYSTQFASANAYTYASVPAAPANFTAADRTRSSMNVAWDNEANSLVLMNTTGVFDFTPEAGQTYTAGGDIKFVGAGNTLELSNLLENQTYYFKIYAVAGEGTSSNYSEALLANAKTKSTAVRMELVGAPDVESGATFSVTAELYNNELVPELVNPAEGTVVTLSKIAGAGTLYGNLTATVAANGTATFNGLSYFGTAGFTLRVSTVVNNVTLSADKAIVIAPAAPTQQDRAILFSGVTATGMTVKWTKGNGTHRILAMQQGNSVSFTPAAGIAYTNESVVNGSTIYTLEGNELLNNQKVLTGLTAGQTYTFRVFNYNNPTNPKYCTATGTFNPRSRATLTKGEVAPKDELTEADINTNTFFVGTINPNPVVNTINFKMTKHEEMNMSIVVFDAAGREVATLVNNQLQAIGTHDYSFNLDNALSSGTYLLVVTAGEQTAVQSFSVVK